MPNYFMLPTTISRGDYAIEFQMKENSNQLTLHIRKLEIDGGEAKAAASRGRLSSSRQVTVGCV